MKFNMKVKSVEERFQEWLYPESATSWKRKMEYGYITVFSSAGGNGGQEILDIGNITLALVKPLPVGSIVTVEITPE